MDSNVSNLIPPFVSEIKGFLEKDEGFRLFDLALDACSLGPCLEIGSFCGKSTVYLGMACKLKGGTLFTIDHHRGNEEQQPGQMYYDDELMDSKIGLLDSLPCLRDTLRKACLEDTVVPMITTSEVAARDWVTPLALVFIDGGHSYEAVLTDYQCWYPHLLTGGYLTFHDIYQDQTQGGQAPYEVYKLALASGMFEELPMTGSLGVLRRYNPVVIKKQVSR
jgi:predicted O-methyltransferase YrrM